MRGFKLIGAAVEASRPRRTGAAAPVGVVGDSELEAQRQRLTERFALLQSELGGLFYEMAVRDHVKMDVLIARAADLQKLDIELSQVEHLLAGGAAKAELRCPTCDSPHARGASYCSQCATPLAAE